LRESVGGRRTKDGYISALRARKRGSESDFSAAVLLGRRREMGKERRRLPHHDERREEVPVFSEGKKVKS